MIQDRLSMFSNAQAETTVTTHDSTNVLDIGTHGDDLQHNITWFVQVRDAVTSDGNATVKFSLYTGETADACTTLLHETAAIAKTALTAGSFPVKIPLPANVGKFLKVVYTIGTAALTGGTFDSGLAWGIDQTA